MERMEEMVVEEGRETSHIRYSRRCNSWLGQCGEGKRPWGEETERLGCARKPNRLLGC